jgi:type II secretory pathway component GspD/PulD (secretin)
LEGIHVSVTPIVQNDTTINLSIVPDISNLTGWSPKGDPIVSTRSITTEVDVRNNGIFVLGGLKKREQVNIRKGVPVLKEIPFLRLFFSVKKEAVIERDVLIIVRPTTDIETSLSSEAFNEMVDQYQKATGLFGDRPNRRRTFPVEKMQETEQLNSAPAETNPSYRENEDGE